MVYSIVLMHFHAEQKNGTLWQTKTLFSLSLCFLSQLCMAMSHHIFFYWMQRKNHICQESLFSICLFVLLVLCVHSINGQTIQRITFGFSILSYEFLFSVGLLDLFVCLSCSFFGQSKMRIIFFLASRILVSTTTKPPRWKKEQANCANWIWLNGFQLPKIHKKRPSTYHTGWITFFCAFRLKR